MAGNRIGGLKVAAKNKAKDPDYYVNLGKKSSKNYMQLPKEERKPRGLAYIALHDPERFKQISARGGSRGRRKEQ